MCPRNDGISRSPIFSMSALRGLANWPAMRPTLMVGTPRLYVSTTAICKMTRSFSRMLLAENSSKLSAQSPACNKNALPAHTCASEFCSARASPANTNGGYEAICFNERSTALWSGHFGCCTAGNDCHDEGVQVLAMKKA